MKPTLLLVSDSPRPNLALAKMAAAFQDEYVVEFAPSMDWAFAARKPFDDNYIFASWIFKREKGADWEGGPASLDPWYELPEHIEKVYPDFSHWSEMENRTMGYLTRGCPRRCPWCCVPDNEGAVTRQVAEVNDIWRGERQLEIMDANLLALPKRRTLCLLGDIAATKAQVDFTQGLDCRLIDDEIAAALARVRVKTYRISCDTDAVLPFAEVAMRRLWAAKRTANITCYVFVDWRNHDWLENAMRRIDHLAAVDFDVNYETDGVHRFIPFIMLWDKDNAPLQARHLQRWCNRPAIYRSIPFSEYNP